MANADFTIRKGDTASQLADTLKDADGNPVDISGATVTFTMTPVAGGAAKVDAATASNGQTGDGSDGTKGQVSYTWTADDTDTDGYYLGAWQVTFADETVQTYPNDGYILIHVTPTAPTSAGQDYITPEELKAARDISSYSSADGQIPLAITAASRAIDNACGRRFYLDADADQVRYYTPDRPDRLMIDDIVTVTSLETDNNGDGTFEYTWTAGSDFVTEPVNAAADAKPYTQLVKRENGTYWFPCYAQSVKVTGRFGWPSVPDAIKQATLILAVRYLTRAREATFGVLSVGGPVDGTAMRIARTDPDVFELIKPYMRRAPLL